MEISRQTKKHLMQVIAFAILLYCAIEHLDVVIGTLRFVLGIAMPFLSGGVIAFILNVPMKKIEKHLFTKNKKMDKFRRPLAYVLTLVCLIGVLALALVVVIPELGNTITMLAEQIPIAAKSAQQWITEIPEKWPALAPAIEELNIDWSAISASAVQFVQSVASGVVSSGVGFFSGVVSGVASFVIAFTFSIYVLFQKEKLTRQTKQVLYAILPDRVTEKVIAVAKLSNQIFSSFLSGQCLEAVILGTMFVIAMSIFGMPYAMLTGIVIAITALIPIFGAFIGCVIGMLLIVMVNPIQALWFLVLFLVLQQLEGNLIYPHVVGGSIGLPSIWVLVAVTVGGNLFGIAGILFFIPMCSVLYALFRTFVKKRLTERKVPESKWRA
ncbi:MAG: AI-2E family transporter [Clostridiales bacterium]|nr:AI-2E family transporter [Roseburia sp.]MDD7635702.1 AI-2E family transporter [Clostridiales bacterium]MDY4111590.1 AI-2E family transporter [Roseburia sp.]